MSDGNRSLCPDDQSLSEFPNDQYFEYFIPKGNVIRGGEVMISKENGLLFGIKLWDANKKVLLETFGMESFYWRERPDVSIIEFALKIDERIVGIRSSGGGDKRALHYDFQLIIGLEPTKFVLLKNLVNKKLIISHVLGKIPNGVFREVIKYVRY